METKIYYRDRQAGRRRSLKREAQIARFWSGAAIPLRHTGPGLAVTCEHKADFWTDPDRWTDAQIERVGIKLQDVSVAYRKLVAPTLLGRHGRLQH